MGYVLFFFVCFSFVTDRGGLLLIINDLGETRKGENAHQLPENCSPASHLLPKNCAPASHCNVLHRPEIGLHFG